MRPDYPHRGARSRMLCGPCIPGSPTHRISRCKGAHSVRVGRASLILFARCRACLRWQIALQAQAEFLVGLTVSGAAIYERRSWRNLPVSRRYGGFARVSVAVVEVCSNVKYASSSSRPARIIPARAGRLHQSLFHRESLLGTSGTCGRLLNGKRNQDGSLLGMRHHALIKEQLECIPPHRRKWDG